MLKLQKESREYEQRRQQREALYARTEQNLVHEIHQLKTEEKRPINQPTVGIESELDSLNPTSKRESFEERSVDSRTYERSSGKPQVSISSASGSDSAGLSGVTIDGIVQGTASDLTPTSGSNSSRSGTETRKVNPLSKTVASIEITF